MRDDDDALASMLCGDRAHTPCDALLEHGKVLTVRNIRMLRITVKMLQRLGILGVDLTEEAPFPSPEVKFAQSRIGYNGQTEPRCKRCRRLHRPYEVTRIERICMADVEMLSKQCCLCVSLR